MNYEHISLVVNNHIAHITIKSIAIDIPFAKELLAVALCCDENPSIRTVIISSDQKLFCAGGDLAAMVESGSNISLALKELTFYFHGAISLFNRMKKPTIAVVNGAAAGVGVSLAIQCDFVIAAESAYFVSAYTAAGLSPDGGLTYLLPRLIGERRAKEMMITNRKLPAKEALDWGLINQVVSDGTELETALQLAAQLSTGATLAYSSVKQLLSSSSNESLESQMSFEAELIAANASGLDGQEGISAFLEKRRANFKGQL